MADHDCNRYSDRKSSLVETGNRRPRRVGRPIDAVTDRQILAAYRLLARSEGVFVEPASAASVAGLLATAVDGRLPRGSKVVCTVTGNGLKDPEWAISGAPTPVTVPVDAHAAAGALGLA
jgi:threonine synthase